MTDAASFDAILQCNLLEVFCEGLGTAILVWDKLDNLTFASLSLLQYFPIREAAIAPGSRARDLFGQLYDAGCRFSTNGQGPSMARTRDEWIAERVACSWKERIDTIEQMGADRHVRVIGRRFSSGLGFTILQDVSDIKRKESLWRAEQERVRLTEEILDSLPVAIAIKDRNLNFAAVNQEFCRLHDTNAEALLGKSAWDFADAASAGLMEQEDWQLLASGEDREQIVHFADRNGRQKDLLHRARRIGRPGQHYLAMSFDPLTAASARTLDLAQSPKVEPPSSERCVVRPPNKDENAQSKSKDCEIVETVAKVLIVGALPKAHAGLADRIRAFGIELCVLDNAKELAAFLPAAAAAGIQVDHIFHFGDDADIAAGIDRSGLAASIFDRQAPLSALMAAIGVVAPQEGLQKILAPHEPQKPAAVVTPSAAMEHAIDVLAVEDNLINRMALEQICESLGLDFVLAASGHEAIALAQARRPRIILADSTLPDMAPDALVEGLCSLFDCDRPAIIGMLPLASDEARALCLNAGMREVVTKPLSADMVDGLFRTHAMAGSPALRTAA